MEDQNFIDWLKEFEEIIAEKHNHIEQIDIDVVRSYFQSDVSLSPEEAAEEYAVGIKEAFDNWVETYTRKLGNMGFPMEQDVSTLQGIFNTGISPDQAANEYFEQKR